MKEQQQAGEQSDFERWYADYMLRVHRFDFDKHQQGLAKLNTDVENARKYINDIEAKLADPNKRNMVTGQDISNLQGAKGWMEQQIPKLEVGKEAARGLIEDGMRIYGEQVRNAQGIKQPIPSGQWRWRKDETKRSYIMPGKVQDTQPTTQPSVQSTTTPSVSSYIPTEYEQGAIAEDARRSWEARKKELLDEMNAGGLGGNAGVARDMVLGNLRQLYRDKAILESGTLTLPPKSPVAAIPYTLLTSLVDIPNELGRQTIKGLEYTGAIKGVSSKIEKVKQDKINRQLEVINSKIPGELNRLVEFERLAIERGYNPSTESESFLTGAMPSGLIGSFHKIYGRLKEHYRSAMGY